MLPTNKIMQRSVIILMLAIFASSAVKAQTTQPTWWFGVSGAANLNWYDGTTQRLDNNLFVPSAFHKGFGAGPYGSVLLEYRPAGIWGFTFNVAYDSRAAKFDDGVAPCNCPVTLKTTTSYISVEPALRLGIPATHLYFFAGPRVAFNINSDYAYTQLKQPNTDGNLSSMHKTILSGQVGAGYDFPVSSPNSLTKVSLSPFVSFHPYFGQAPREIESWQVTTLRVGMALKFGRGEKIAVKETPVAIVPVADPEVDFSVRAPKTVPVQREVSETLPVLNSVFFDDGSSQIPARYVALSVDQASAFREAQLQNAQAESMSGRSGRQLYAYHNILNVLGDRMRANPGTTITLSGASAKGAEDGRALAESVKTYLVVNFGINDSRIGVQGRNKPIPPSEQPGGTRELVLLRAEDRRVDIASNSPELLLQVGGGMMKPMQIMATQYDPLDSYVVFNATGAKDAFKSWTITSTDVNGMTKSFGPYYTNKESVPGSAILGNSPTGDYIITLTGITKSGKTVTKTSTVHLIRDDHVVVKGYRYSIVFDFDKAKSIASYDRFLREVVAPSIPDGSTVIIHGHTDIIGIDTYNQKLSDDRAQQTQKVMENAFVKAGKNNIKFETSGYGEDVNHAPFENVLPEERFYNRTVIIDIIPAK
jgi:outer membrane protein OmpA-like peptidoglycan-associated protein